MDDISQSVAESIKSGDYFRDARNWYAHRYLSPIVERSLLLIVTIGCIFVSLATLLTCYLIFPITKEVPFIIQVADGLDYYSHLEPLRKTRYRHEPQIAVTEYLVTNYVKSRESYYYKDIEKQMIRIRGTSSKQLYKKFEAYMSTQNPDSPLLVYQKNTVRTIDVKKITLSGPDLIPDHALIVFEATVDDRVKKEKTTSQWEASLMFTISDINAIHEQRRDTLNFIVTDYKVTPIQ